MKKKILKQDFLSLEEMEIDKLQLIIPNENNAFIQPKLHHNDAAVIEFNSVFVKWPVSTGEKEEKTLSDVSFTIHSNKLLTVLGKIGSGKVMFI